MSKDFASHGGQASPAVPLVLEAAWLAPQGLPGGAGALMTTRAGGVSTAPYQSMNLGARVGDAPAAVAANRGHLARATGCKVVYLHQVHGHRVVRIGAAWEAGMNDEAEADASYTTEPGWACVVQTADCLPVLFAARDEQGAVRGVAAAHAGWRGLAAGVLEATARALLDATSCGAADLWAWIGPGIGPAQFEVGADVLQAFGASAAEPGPYFKTQDESHWLANLAGLARARLQAMGTRDVHGGVWCTVSDSRFYSFRRDRITGRMAACIWLRPPGLA